jgi:hypothetical protein
LIFVSFILRYRNWFCLLGGGFHKYLLMTRTLLSQALLQMTFCLLMLSCCQ